MKDVLREVFGFEELRGGQGEVVEILMAGRSALAVFPTGGGKSLCYQLPALLLEGVVVVVSPLLALMKDQVDGLVAKGVAAARLDSTLGFEEAEGVMASLVRGELKLLYVSPERFAKDGFVRVLRGLDISMVAVDEAHCISEWGHNFRPDYLKLGKVCRRLKVGRVLCLTATATVKVERDIRKQFRVGMGDVVKLSFHRRNLDLRISVCVEGERKGLLLERLRRPGAAVVYVTRQETAEEVATFLARNGVGARAYHAGLRMEARGEVQEGFMGGSLRVVVATIAFGMGVDKADIRQVIHYNMPKSLEGYSQEIGRAGRDGEAAVCEWLACAGDRTVLENFIFSDTPGERAMRNLLERVLRMGKVFDVSLYELSVSCDIRQTVVSTVLVYLEMEGLMEPVGTWFERYRIKFLRPAGKVLAGRGGREKRLLEAVFEGMEEEWKWHEVRISEKAGELGVDGERLRVLLEELEAAGELVSKKAGWRHGFRVRKEPEDVGMLIRVLVERFTMRERAELKRLDEVMGLVAEKRCLTAYILRHFGESIEGGCGHCDRCRGVAAVKLKRAKGRRVTDEELEVIRELVREGYAALGTGRRLARFLCGMSSPAAMRERLYRHDAYGLLADVPFADVLVVGESFRG